MEVEYRSANGEEVLETRNCPSLVKRAIASIKIAGINTLNSYNKQKLPVKQDENLVFCHKE